jgi:hypothetical protein
MTRSRIVVLALVVGVAVSVAACVDEGGDVAALAAGRPKTVPDGIVPATVQGGALAFHRNDGETVTKTFANAGDHSLVADGQLWELRKNDRLLGALQLSTLVPKSDMSDARQRGAIVRQVMSGSVEQFDVNGVPVWTTAANDKAVYLWFGRSMYSVLSLKGSELDAEAIANEVVGFQSASAAWEPIVVDDGSWYDDAEKGRGA